MVASEEAVLWLDTDARGHGLESRLGTGSATVNHTEARLIFQVSQLYLYTTVDTDCIISSK